MKRVNPSEETTAAAEEPLKKKAEITKKEEEEEEEKAPELTNEVIILPQTKKLKKKSKSKSKSKPSENDDDDDDDESGPMEELQVDFDFFNQQPKDRRAIYGLVKNLLCGRDFDVDGLTQAIINADVGSVVKSDGYDDALAVITILDLEEDAPCNDENTEWIKNILKCLKISKDEAKDMGLIINERIVNMPTFTLAPAIHKSVFNELEKERPITAKRFKKYLLIAPYCNVVSKAEGKSDDDDDSDDSDESDDDVKDDVKSDVITGGKGEKKNEFVRPEEEIYLSVAEKKIEIAPGGGHQDPRPTIAGLVCEHAVAGIIDAKKIPGVLKQIEKIYLQK